jgi:hypothetical protein
MRSEITVGPCPHCQQELAQPARTLPRRLNLCVSRLDDAERRWSPAGSATATIACGPHSREAVRRRGEESP